MKAKIVAINGKATGNGREKILRVKAGEKGTGQQFGPDIVCWPWHPASVDAAYKVADEIAKRYSLEIE